VPHRQSTGDEFIGDPSGHGHHRDTPVLDLLHAKASELLGVPSTLTLGESKWIVSVVSRNVVWLVVLTVVGNALEPSSHEKDLKPSSGRDHANGIERGSVGNVGKGDTRRGREQPRITGFWGKGVGSRWSEVERKVDSELLGHESNSGDHGNTSVLDFSVLEPLEGRRLGIFQDAAAERRALVSSLYGHTKGVIDSGVDCDGRALAARSRGESGSSAEAKGEGSESLHRLILQQERSQTF